MASGSSAGRADGSARWFGAVAAGAGWPDRLLASYIADFAFHDEFHPQRTEDGAVVDGADYILLLRDLEGSLEETGVYGDAEAEEDTGASLDPEAGRGEPSTSRRGARNA